MQKEYLQSAITKFEYYKSLGDKTFSQLEDEHLFVQLNEECNSIAIIVKHMWGNMLSRWTDFLTTDGEKDCRKRDAEFEKDDTSRAALILKWEEGWACIFAAIKPLTENDFKKDVFIRNEKLTVVDAINRQLAHYAYHVGQIVFIGKMYSNNNWESLSIPKGNSEIYNKDKFSENKK